MSGDRRATTGRERAVLEAAPIGVDDVSNGDPLRGPSYRYQGADGRTARALWARGLLSYREVNPHGGHSGLLYVTNLGRAALGKGA